MKSKGGGLHGLRDFFLFKTNQIIDMKRKRNGAEIRSMRPDDMLFPMQNSIPKSITLRAKEWHLKSEGSGGGMDCIWPQL